MLVVYASKTGNVARFVEPLEVPKVRITSGEERVHEPCVLITYTAGFGLVPLEVERFVQHNLSYIRGVVASGNRNWGPNFARSADVLREKYGLPVLHKFELSGQPRDRQLLLQHLRALSAQG